MGTIGVIIGRFQVDQPHEGHRNLIEQVHRHHGKVLIGLGCSPVKLSETDPLDFSTRAVMMQKEFPWATVLPVNDSPSDEIWSRSLDQLITETFKTEIPVLYGSRDSFIPHYRGKLKVVELETIRVPSGTEVRAQIADHVRNSEDFRAGVIYACANRFPISYQTVDIAILRGVKKQVNSLEGLEVLLGKKPWDGGLRFVGGFVDPRDPTLEIAASREAREETQLEISTPHYLGSHRINDWRYRERNDKILTAFFVARYVYGYARASDDIAQVQWVPLNSLPGVLIEEHRPLGEILLRHVLEQ